MREVLNPTRRVMLGRLAVAAPLAAVAGAGAYATASPPHPDATLLALGRELDAAWAAERAAWAEAAGDDWSRGEAAASSTAAVVHRIERTSARTLDGLLVKSRAVSWCVCGEEFTPDEGETTDLRLAYAIVADLRRIAAEGRA